MLPEHVECLTLRGIIDEDRLTRVASPSVGRRLDLLDKVQSPADVDDGARLRVAG